ncbi:hypothetical protein NLG97_g1949 [Lecanicillium saksenae]|uniref:Uncharacterized protein n=1 Tax=Lecanicillium saksenae TaxID=468837 RepID=A0ACC1R3K7_9HYPO|nr:hypothetical protein NLG97_g1949 [Lecanicillium saksenae]
MTNFRHKQIRIGGSRSKKGCTTCKIRKVKCDETKPSCKRCVSTGRKCDGYEPVSTLAIASSPKPFQQISAAPLCRTLLYRTAHGSAHVHGYFYHHCLEQVFGGSQFKWIQPLIAQLGEHDDAISAAVVAFSSMHKAEFLFSQDNSFILQSSDGSDARRKKSATNLGEILAAATAYGKSVRALQKRIDQGGRVAVPIALVCCILFAAFNMIQCDYDGAVRHIEYGLGIVAKEQTIERSGGKPCLPGWSTTAADSTMSALVSGFQRLAIAAFFYGRTETLLQEQITIAPSPLATQRLSGPSFAHIHEARSSLTLVAGSVLKFAADVSSYHSSGTSPPLECIGERDKKLEYIYAWRAAFLAISSVSDGGGTDPISIRMLHLLLDSQLLALIVVLRTSLDLDETGYDECFDEFRQILILCQEYISIYSSSSTVTGTSRQVDDFTFDMEILPQLWLIGKKCRHRQYRRWGIDLLHKYRRKEGVWDPALICNLAKRTMEIEEANVPSDDTSLPSNLDRLWMVDLDSRYANGSLAQFAYKPTTLGGRGLSWEEMILTDPQ